MGEGGEGGGLTQGLALVTLWGAWITHVWWVVGHPWRCFTLVWWGEGSLQACGYLSCPTSDNACGLSMACWLVPGALILVSKVASPYFLPATDFRDPCRGARHHGGLPLLVQLDGEGELPEAQLVLQGQAHLPEVTHPHGGHGVVLDTRL